MTPPTTAGSASVPTCYLHGIPMTPRGFPPLCVSWLCQKCATLAGAGFAIPEVHYLHVEGTPPNPPTTLTTYNAAETQLTALRAAVVEYLEAKDDMGDGEGFELEDDAAENEERVRAAESALRRLATEQP